MIRPTVYCGEPSVRRAGQQQYLPSTVLPFSSSGGTHATAVYAVSRAAMQPWLPIIARVNRTLVKLKSKRTDADLLGRVRIGRCCVPATAPRNKSPARQSPRRTARSRSRLVGACHLRRIHFAAKLKHWQAKRR
jgi:hypothetical protein